IGAAVAAASSALEPLAQKALAAGDKRDLDFVAGRWFYLAPHTASAVKTAAAATRGRGALALARLMERAFSLEQKRIDKIVEVEAAQVFAEVETLARDPSSPSAELVRGRLAPYAARAFDAAEARVRERGVSADALAYGIIDNHARLFGGRAGRGLFKTLAARGQWTEFVAAVSLYAEEKLVAAGARTRAVLATAAVGDDLRLAIPAWHPLAAHYPSVASWMSFAHDRPDDARNGEGARLFTAFGIPVFAKISLWPALLIGGFQFAWMFAKTTPAFGPVGHFAQALAVSILMYASVLAHEYGHAFSARWFGIRTRKIVLHIMGGGADVERGFRQALPEFVIALAGPVVSALIGVGAVVVAQMLFDPVVAPVLMLVGVLNLVLSVMNMLPLFPMDGARVLRASLTRPFGSYRATKIVGGLSLVLSLLLIGSGAYGLPGALGFFQAGFGLFFLHLSRVMSVHPGTVTIDERPPKAF
ncbi:MAG: M50 family metallopeptidase, partial [Elusimicrobia bacterium]|nr:M50 family metallopeptidase [Elusimicrobiota bacterium]